MVTFVKVGITGCWCTADETRKNHVSGDEFMSLPLSFKHTVEPDVITHTDLSMSSPVDNI